MVWDDGEKKGFAPPCMYVHSNPPAFLNIVATWSRLCRIAFPSAVYPYRSFSLIFAPRSNNSCTTVACPEAATQCSAVRSPQPFSWICAPFSSNSCTTVACPDAAAQCSAVLPCRSFLLISTPFLNKTCTTVSCPESAARCSAVYPSRSFSLTASCFTAVNNLWSNSHWFRPATCGRRRLWIFASGDCRNACRPTEEDVKFCHQYKFWFY